MQFVSYLLEIFYMVFSSCKDHSLLLRLHYIPKQIKQQSCLVIHTNMEK